MSAIQDEGSAIVSRMRELRSTGQSDISRLHAQAERVTDWREHVRAQPVLTAVSSTVVGYMLVRALAGGPGPTTVRHSATVQTAASSSAQLAKPASVSAGILSLAGGIALSVGRQWVTEYLKKQIGVNAHVANQSNNSDQRYNSRSQANAE
ncbi:MAG: hypothetical protein SFV81_05115 [Pirellulaceae bacterium]|nr:hypothetical protein [Pirellulaceae bacterium]